MVYIWLVNTQKLIDIVYHIKTREEKLHGLVNICRKLFDIYQHLFVRITLSKIGTQEKFLNLAKHIYKIPITNIIFIAESLKTFPKHHKSNKNVTSIQHHTGNPNLLNKSKNK